MSAVPLQLHQVLHLYPLPAPDASFTPAEPDTQSSQSLSPLFSPERDLVPPPSPSPEPESVTS